MIIVGEYQCKFWTNVDTMKEELAKFNFRKLSITNHYDMNHKMHLIFMMERKKPYEHKSLIDEEPFWNINNEIEIKKIKERVHKDVND